MLDKLNIQTDISEIKDGVNYRIIKHVCHRCGKPKTLVYKNGSIVHGGVSLRISSETPVCQECSFEEMATEVIHA